MATTELKTTQTATEVVNGGGGGTTNSEYIDSWNPLNNTINYQALQPLPGLEDKNIDLGVYLKGVFNFGIGIASALAVLMIVIGGFQYMTQEAISGKTDAKIKIQNAVIGLILALTSYLILYTLDKDLVTFDFEEKLPAIEKIEGSTSSSGQTDEKNPNTWKCFEGTPTRCYCQGSDCYLSGEADYIETPYKTGMCCKVYNTQ
ncbi:MAG: pilin [Patescibacteria group bacterium]